MFARFSLLIVVLIRLASGDTHVIIEFAQALPPPGMDRPDPVVEGARSRLVVMIALAVISGVLPLATTVGAGTGGSKAPGIPVLIGMPRAWRFSLLCTPRCYFLVRRFSKTKPAGSRTRASRVEPLEEPDGHFPVRHRRQLVDDSGFRPPGEITLVMRAGLPLLDEE